MAAAVAYSSSRVEQSAEREGEARDTALDLKALTEGVEDVRTEWRPDSALSPAV
jgi:hypothetical protein